MTKSVISLGLTVLVISSLVPAVLVVCSTCSVDPTDQDWAASATSFIEGKPVNDVPSTVSPAQQYRIGNTEFNSSLLREGSEGQGSNGANSSESNTAASNTAVSDTAPSNTATTPAQNTPILNIVLDNISAVPNPANFSVPVMLTAAFGNNSSNPQVNATPNNLSTGTDLKNLMVYADIKSSAGIAVSRINLQRTSGNEYAGIWNTNVSPGTYRATIGASGSGGSKTFSDALQIVVNGSKNARNTPAVRDLG